MKKFNEFLDVIAFCVIILLESINNIIMNTFDKLFRSKCDFVTDYCIDLNKINYGVIQFKLIDINYDNINAIVNDSFHSGPPGYRYMCIYNNKGELMMNYKLLQSLINDDNLYFLCHCINYNCN